MYNSGLLNLYRLRWWKKLTYFPDSKLVSAQQSRVSKLSLIPDDFINTQEVMDIHEVHIDLATVCKFFSISFRAFVL